MKTKSLLLAGFLGLLAGPVAGQNAESLYQQLCDDGDMLGCDLLGMMYRDGEGVTQNLAAAADLFRKACDGFKMVSCSRLGVMYTNGAGVTLDVERGLDLFRLACDGGDVQGCDNYGVLVGLVRVALLGRLPLEDRRLAIGVEGFGTLSDADPEGPDGSYLQAWSLTLTAGQEVTADLTSADFDSYLLVTGPGFASELSDDDSGGGCGARITFTAPEDGEYRAIVGAAGPKATGRFVLMASETPPPTIVGPCRRDVDPARMVTRNRPATLSGRTGAPTGPTEGSSSVIIRAQLAEYDGQSALDVIRRYNSRWLRTTRLGAVGPGSPPSSARVSLDGATPGDLADLDTIPANSIEFMRYLTATEATTRYGTGFSGGIIELTSRAR